MQLSQYCSLIDTMARLSLKADASRYFFGYVWWVLEPLLYVAVFYVVFELILQNRKEDFVVFLLLFNGYVITVAWFWLILLVMVNYIVVLACCCSRGAAANSWRSRC